MQTAQPQISLLMSKVYLYNFCSSVAFIVTARKDPLCVNKIILLSSEPQHSSEIIANQPHHSVLSVDLNKVILILFLLMADGKFSHLCMTGKLHQGQGQAELGFHVCYDRKPSHEKTSLYTYANCACPHETAQMCSLMRACTICF